MTTRSQFVIRATVSALASITLGVWGGSASASVPPTEPPPGTEATAPPAGAEPIELVQSWTLTPGGSVEGDAVGTRPNLSYQIDPGTVVEDTVIVYNLGNVAMDFRIYATDAFNNDDGEFDLLEGDQVPIDVGSWVTLAQEGIVLPPGKQATIPITITVPADATPGDHVGAIVASNVVVSDNDDGQVVSVDRRTGTRMYIQVGGPLARELAITDLHTSYRHAFSPLDGSAEVTFRVENRGNVRLGGTPSVSIAGPLGLGKRTIALPALTELLPGQDVTLTARLDDVAALVVDSTTARIDPVEPADVGGVEPTVGKDRTFAPPISVLMILLAMVLAVLARRAVRTSSRSSGAGIRTAARGRGTARTSATASVAMVGERNSTRMAILALPMVLALGVAPIADSDSSIGGPVVNSTRQEVEPGEQTVLTIDGFISPYVTISICGNEARRGSADCNMSATEGVEVRGDEPLALQVAVAEPPVDCPCVIRVVGKDSGEVAVTPIVVIGHPLGPLVDPPIFGDLVAISITAKEYPTGALDALRSALGGRTRYQVIVKVKNIATTPLKHVSVSASAGRSAADDSLASLELDPPGLIGVGQTWQQTVTVAIPAPAFGATEWRAVVSGTGQTVYGVSTTEHRPWLLIVLVMVVVLNSSLLLIRWRVRRHAASTQSTSAETTSNAAIAAPVDAAPDDAVASVDGGCVQEFSSAT